MTSTDEKENKRKFAWWVKDSTIELVGKLYKDDDCTSRSEFIEKAVIFYAGYLGWVHRAHAPPQHPGSARQDR